MLRNSLYRLAPYLHRHSGGLMLGSICLLATNCLALVQPWILKYVVDGLYEGIDRGKLLSYAALVVGFSLAEGVFRFWMRRILIGISRHIEYDLRNDLFAHLENLSLSFFQRTKTGDLMSRLNSDLGAVRMVLGPGIMYSMNTLVTASIAVVLLFGISWQLTSIVLIPLALVSLSVKRFGQQIHERFERIQEQFSDISAKVQENLTGIRVVKAFAREDSEIESFRRLNLEYVKRNISLIRLWGTFYPTLGLLLGTSAVLLLWLGGRYVIIGKITLGEMVAFMGYLSMLSWPVIALGWVVNIFQRGAASMERLNQILDQEPEIRDTARTLPIKAIEGEIEFRNLTFAYRTSQRGDGQMREPEPALKNISLKIKKGTTVAIVGRTGSGKSTLANLIARLYEAPEGSLLIDGIPIQMIPLSVLRASIGYVPQETFLFSDTIEGNIAFGRESYTLEEIEQAARASSIYSEIQGFPDKWRTKVGERGITLSGGQKQRTAIARALMMNPKILILDDALSSVDANTEEKILSQLKRLFEGRTVIIIAHRISVVKDADHIVVLDEGRIVEEGSHQELLGRGGLYAELYQKQLLEEELAAI